jgi:hypothetical protein
VQRIEILESKTPFRPAGVLRGGGVRGAPVQEAVGGAGARRHRGAGPPLEAIP